MTTLPVLIAGGGPVGMPLALELARRGVARMLVERNPSTTRHPKMDITNARSMELFRRLGVTDALRAVAVPEDHQKRAVLRGQITIVQQTERELDTVVIDTFGLTKAETALLG